MSMGKPELSNPVALRLPVDVLEQIEAIADTCERTRSWVIVRALKLYLSSEGDEILSIRRGREQLAAGQSHDLDDVMRELEAIVAGKVA
jgi:predicted transcriptional regulator